MVQLEDAVVREVRIAARPDIVFAYFTDPARMVQWKGVSANLDPKPGGVYDVRINAKHIARGEYLAIEPYSRVAFTWGWEGHGEVPPGASTVEVTLRPDGDGTLLRLCHSGLPSEAERTGHAEGWDHYLSRLAIRATGGDPGVDPWSVEAEAATA
jgi:uncharacterized protein YndB with AHSA1/START domain